MRDPKRISIILRKIEEIWTENPDFRLTQLLVNAMELRKPIPEIYYREDDILLEELTALQKAYNQKKSS